jgi:hypothetical protein
MTLIAIPNIYYSVYNTSEEKVTRNFFKRIFIDSWYERISKKF